MTIYRKIWEKRFGSIPKDSDGRSYEIHHIDGNRKNNDISNLKCVSIQEHYDIHYSQGDWAACSAILKRTKISPELLSELATKNNKKRVENGTNPFLGPKINQDRIKNGTHHLLGGNLQRKQVREGTHNFVCENPSKKEWYCKECDTHGRNMSVFAKFHGEKCKKRG